MRYITYCSIFIVALSLMIFTGSVNSYAVQEAGDMEAMVNSSFVKPNDSDVGVLNGSVSLGYYFTESFELGVRQGLNYEFRDNANDTWTATTVPFVSYHILTGNVQPYVSAGAGIVWNSDDVTGTIAPGGGVKAYVTDSAFVNVGYTYEWFFDEFDYETVDESSSDGNHVVAVGVGFVF